MKQLFFLPAALFMLVLSGCNVFDSGDGFGKSNDPKVLLTDAQQAMEQGEPAKAVEILEKAIAKSTPDSREWVQAHLQIVTAELAATGVTVLDLQNLVEDLDATVEGQSGKGGAFQGFAGQVCSFGAGEQALEKVDLTKIAGWAKFASSLQSYERIEQWTQLVVSRNGWGVWSEERMKGAIEEGVREGYDKHPELRSLYQSVLLSYSVAQFGIAYSEIVAAGGAEIEWYRVQAAGGGYYLGYCASSQQVIEQAKQQTACSMSRIARMIAVLEVRASLFPSVNSYTLDLIEKVQTGYDKLKVELDGVCPVGSGG